MTTILNKMVKRVVDPISNNATQQLFRKSFLMGAMGYFVFLFTLATSNWFISKQFRFGLSGIDSKDLMTSWVGFFIIFGSYFIRGIKNTFYE